MDDEISFDDAQLPDIEFVDLAAPGPRAQSAARAATTTALPARALAGLVALAAVVIAVVFMLFDSGAEPEPQVAPASAPVSTDPIDRLDGSGQVIATFGSGVEFWAVDAETQTATLIATAAKGLGPGHIASVQFPMVDRARVVLGLGAVIDVDLSPDRRDADGLVVDTTSLGTPVAQGPLTEPPTCQRGEQKLRDVLSIGPCLE